MRRSVHPLVLSLLALAACGGNDADAPEGGEPRASGGAPVALAGTVNDHGTRDLAGAATAEVELDDFYFGPTFVKSAPGTALTLTLKNEGEAPHTFTVDGFGVDQTVQPGAEGTATVTLPAAGAVRFYCRFHAGQGMQGAFYVNAGDTIAPAPGGASGSATGDGGDGAYNQ